jgi:hypothetical protein
MKKKAPPFWQLPAIVAASVTALGVLGTGTVKLAKFLTVTDRVDAAEAKNLEQDDSIKNLSYIAGQNQQILDRVTQQQAPNQTAPVPEPWEFIKQEGDFQIFRDPEGVLRCCNGTTCEPKPTKGKCR